MKLNDTLMNFYLPENRRAAKEYNPVDLLRLISLFGLGHSFRVVDRLDAVGDQKWASLVRLGNAYRLSSSLSSRKGGNIVYFNGLNEEEKARISETDGQLLLDLAVEPIFSRHEFFEGIHEGLDEAGLDARRLWILNNNMLSAAAYGEYCLEHDIVTPANILPFHGCYWMLVGHNFGSEQQPLRDRILTESADANRHRSKAFASFNGRMRNHRLQIVLFLLARGLMKKGYLSFLAYSINETVDEAELANMIKRMPFAEETTPYITPLIDMLPLSLDVQHFDYKFDKKYKTLLPWFSPDPHYYLDSYFSIVSDTLMFDGSIMFLTEKIFKSVMNCHPFVFFGCQGGLECLRSLGYRTFAPLIDESYDEEPNPIKRMELALLEVERLAKTPLPALDDMYRALWPNLKHNFDLFWYQSAPAFEETMRSEIWSPMGMMD